VIRAKVAAKIKEQYIDSMHLNSGKSYKCLHRNSELKSFSLLNFVATRDGNIILDYKDMQELMTSSTPLALMDMYNFVSKFLSKIYQNRLINKWLSKRKGENFFDVITTSNIAYTVAVIENSYEYWD
jgi:hypothetical protein